MNKSSVKKNVIANYVGKGYAILIGIVIYPFYLQYMGAEAYGLIGFFLVLEAWLSLLDISMSPVLGRQVAHARGQGKGFLEFKKLLRSFEVIFFGSAAFVTLGIILSSEWIAVQWLNVEAVNIDEIIYCVALMGVMVGLRWIVSLYRNGIRGMEAQVWLNSVGVVMGTIKFAGVLPVIIWISAEPSSYFEYQLLIGVIELLVFKAKFYSLIPDKSRAGLAFSGSTMKPLVPFILSTAYASGIMILITQFDKVLLSNILSLGEYGYFALVVVVTTGILRIGSPIAQALLPRMTRLLAAGKEDEMIVLYRKASQILAVVMISVSSVVAIFSKELMYIWSGDMQVALWAGPVLFWYVLGSGLFVVQSFQYNLQYAHGDLRLHVRISTISAMFLVPLISFSAYRYGALGTGITWFAAQCIFFLIWPALVHFKFLPGMHFKWLFGDVLPVFLCAAVGMLVVFLTPFDLFRLSRIQGFLTLMLLGTVVLLASCMGSSVLRQAFIRKIKRNN